MSSNAKLFFEELRQKADPFQFLSDIPASYATNPFFEEEWLDFKGAPQNNVDAKKIWSKALSGYANITDGLVIWGIDARKTQPRNIDAACGLRLVTDPDVLGAKLRDWIRDATNPPVMGVEYQSYKGSNGQGFVVCYVPESRHKPHRAEEANRQYYYRAGDDFLAAEPGLLRVLFYPQVQPHLELEVKLSHHPRLKNILDRYETTQQRGDYDVLKGSSSIISCVVSLHNTGTATAKDVYVRMNSTPYSFPNAIPFSDWQRRLGEWCGVAVRAMSPVHPGDLQPVFSCSLDSITLRSIQREDKIFFIPKPYRNRANVLDKY